jgi:nicotinamidase/pyrazinamidase
MKLKQALLIVDVQNDFCPRGALGIKDGDTIIPQANNYIRLFAKARLPIFSSRDWHPARTKHFKQYGGGWPAHCIQNTPGAEFHPQLKLPKEAIIISKGMDPNEDSYSAFQAQDGNGAALSILLQLFGIKELFIGGLATDYCVKLTVRDALKAGIKAYVLIDAIKGVDVSPGDSANALLEMKRAGAREVTLEKAKEMFLQERKRK